MSIFPTQFCSDLRPKTATGNFPMNIKTGNQIMSGIVGASMGRHLCKVCPYHLTHHISQFLLDGEEVPKSWAILCQGEDGYPVLPARPKDALLPEMKNVIREFVKAVHHKDSFGSINARLAHVI
jgi:hypothetical protein